MGDFHAEVVELQRAQALLKLAERKLSDWSPIITRAYHRLDSQQNGTITNVRGAIVGWGRIYDAQWERIKKMISFIDTAMAEMEQAEEQAYKELADAEIREDKKESGNTKPAAGQPDSGSTGNTGATTKKRDIGFSLYQKGVGYYDEIVADKSRVWNLNFGFKSNGKWVQNCTWHTAKKLSMLGVQTIKGLGNGCTWVAGIPERPVTANEYGIKKYGGNDWYERLMEEYDGGPVYNIVLSFDSNTGTSSEIRACGHVMMIDAIVDGKVYYSDTWPEKAACLTIQEFKNQYRRYNGNCLGAAHFYK